MNQLIVLQEGVSGIAKHLLIPASFAASAVVLRKLPPKPSIVDISSGRHFLPLHDIIDLLDLDKGEISFFWKGGRFISASISE